jgi:glycosyltransferase involved in cell wall biosynthesis
VTPQERLWVIETFERITSLSAAASDEKRLIEELTSQLVDLRGRLDALSAIAGQIRAQTNLLPEYVTPSLPKLLNGEFMSPGYIGFDYERVLDSIASWNTAQERMPDFDRYDEWFRVHGRSVTVIIAGSDRRPLARCLTSLQRVREAYSSVRMIVADDASPDQERQAFLDQIERVGLLVIRNRANSGFAGNINSALKLIGDEDIVLLSSDTEAEGFWLEALQYGCYASGSGIAGAKLLYPNRRIQHAGVYRDPLAPLRFCHYYGGQSEFFGPACVPSYQLAVTSTCLYISNRTFKMIGTLDPSLSMALGSVDYCLRAWRAGERVWYYPYARLVRHESPASGLTQESRDLTSNSHFWEKWRAYFDRRPTRAAAGERGPDIVYVLEDTGIAGGHRNVFEHVNLLVDAGLEVELWSLAGHPDWFDLKTNVRSFPDFTALTAALTPLRCVKVATWWNTAQAVWLASRDRGQCAYLVSDIETSYYVNDPFMRARVLSSYKFDFRYFTISKWCQNQLAKLGIKSEIVWCSVDRSKFRPLGLHKRSDVLLAPGRRNNLKNLPLTIKAWAALGEARPHLWMYGSEPDIADFEDRTRYFYEPADTYLNWIINEASAFVLTSRHEGFALTILEAMSAGTPVITTDCHGNRDFCTDGVNCLMVRDGDYAGLTAAIREVMLDGDLRTRLIAGGLATANRFSPRAMQQQLLNFFASVSRTRSSERVTLRKLR